MAERAPGVYRRVAVSLRTGSLVMRFALIFALAAFLSPADVGTYGLVVAFVSYAVYVLGLDMYSYTTRQLASGDGAHRPRILFNHFTFLAIVMAVMVPASLVIFIFGFLPWSLAIAFLLVLITEHLGIEIDRLLISIGQQFRASIVIALRQGLLPLTSIALMAFAPTTRQLSTVLALWITFNFAAIVVGASMLARETRGAGRLGVDWRWIIRGVAVSFPFLVATLLLRLLFTVDRQIVASAGGLDLAAAYTLSVTIAGGLTSLLAISVHQFAYPDLVRSATRQDWTGFNARMRDLWRITLVLSAGAVLGAIVVCIPLTRALGEPIYAENAAAIPSAMIAIAIYNISLVPHYGLYALHADRLIFVATVVSVVVFFSLVAVGVSSLWAVIISLACASLAMLISKYVAFRRSRKTSA